MRNISFLKRLIVESPKRLKFRIDQFSNQCLILTKNGILPINLLIGNCLRQKMITITDIEKKSYKYEYSLWLQYA